jgi:hypothetical protein
MVELRRKAGVSKTQVTVDGQVLPADRISNIHAGKTYKVEVALPGA